MPLDASFKDWLDKANNDLMAAKAILEYYEEPPTDTVCYHCHQVVEKVLKAFLIYRKSELLKVHDLVELLNLCSESEPDLATLRDSVETLNQYYIEAKYPLDIPIIYPLQEAKDAFEKAAIILEKISQKIL